MFARERANAFGRPLTLSQALTALSPLAGESRMALLDRIDTPKALGALPKSERALVCEEERSEISVLLGRVGGHLGAALDSVDRIVVLERTFRFPVDRLRPAGARARRSSWRCGAARRSGRRGSRATLVAFVDGGKRRGGVTLEGFNDVGHGPTLLKVVLNETGVSLSPNVGAVEGLVRDCSARASFGALGLVYLGLVDGQNRSAQAEVLERAMRCRRPVLDAHGLPLGEAALPEAANGAVVTVEEGTTGGGLGSAGHEGLGR
jgi:hypothetical protein